MSARRQRSSVRGDRPSVSPPPRWTAPRGTALREVRTSCTRRLLGHGLAAAGTALGLVVVTALAPEESHAVALQVGLQCDPRMMGAGRRRVHTYKAPTRRLREGRLLADLGGVDLDVALHPADHVLGRDGVDGQGSTQASIGALLGIVWSCWPDRSPGRRGRTRMLLASGCGPLLNGRRCSRAFIPMWCSDTRFGARRVRP
jgi:hypothetical protein